MLVSSTALGALGDPHRPILDVTSLRPAPSGGHHGGGMDSPGSLVTMNPQLKGKVVLNLEHIAPRSVSLKSVAAGTPSGS